MMTITLKFTAVLIITAIFLNSCNSKMPQNSDILPPVTVSGDIAKDDSSLFNGLNSSLPVIPAKIIYNNNFNLIETNGVDNTRIKLIISAINPNYFVNLSGITFTYSNINARIDNIYGIYTLDNKKIQIWVYNETDAQIAKYILHELKHHYCYITTGNAEFGHIGCFLNTPIDREYGFIK